MTGLSFLGRPLPEGESRFRLREGELRVTNRLIFVEVFALAAAAAALGAVAGVGWPSEPVVGAGVDTFWTSTDDFLLREESPSVADAEAGNEHFLSPPDCPTSLPAVAWPATSLLSECGRLDLFVAVVLTPLRVSRNVDVRTILSSSPSASSSSSSSSPLPPPPRPSRSPTSPPSLAAVTYCPLPSCIEPRPSRSGPLLRKVGVDWDGADAEHFNARALSDRMRPTRELLLPLFLPLTSTPAPTTKPSPARPPPSSSRGYALLGRTEWPGRRRHGWRPPSAAAAAAASGLDVRRRTSVGAWLFIPHMSLGGCCWCCCCCPTTEGS